MAVVSLTQNFVRQVRLPAGQKKTQYCDAQVRGLYLEVYSCNRPGTFYYRSHEGPGKRYYYRLGSADVIRLSEARKKALEIQRLQMAQRLQQQVIANLGLHPFIQPEAEQTSSPCLREFFETQALPHMQKNKRSWKTDQQFWRLHILPELGELLMGEVSVQQLREWHLKLQQKALKPASCDRVLVSLKSVFSLAVEWDVIKENPSQRLKLLHQDESRERYLTANEIEQLQTACLTETNRSAALAVLFLLATGARMGEALKAKWCHLDESNQQWTIPQENAKSKKARSLPLNKRALWIIDALKQLPECRDGEYLFTSRLGRPFRDINHTWRKIKTAAGLDEVRLHDLRHTYASLLINAGCSLYEVQQLLGHANADMTQRYAHLTPSTLRSANESVDTAWPSCSSS